MLQGKFHEAGKLYKKTGNDEKVCWLYSVHLKIIYSFLHVSFVYLVLLFLGDGNVYRSQAV